MELILIVALASIALGIAIAFGILSYQKKQRIRTLRATISNVESLAAGGGEDELLEAKKRALEEADLKTRLQAAVAKL